MKIITVNLPVNYLKSIDGLVGEKGLYPSRSELIRVALRDFLIHELESAQSFTKVQNTISVTTRQPELDPSLFVSVPVNAHNELNGVNYKTYRIIKK
jgi:Arc/MetJ-type ribon-helix-helix transcriptional regulator